MSMIGNYTAIKPETLDAFLADPSQVDSFLYPEDGSSPGEIHMDVDKAWHAIHFLLNGEVYGGDPPLCNAVVGGEPIGEDVGYGPARYLTPMQVAEVAAGLESISRESLLEKYDAAALIENNIYPSIWDDAKETLDYIGQYYEAIQRFFADASTEGYAAMIYIN